MPIITKNIFFVEHPVKVEQRLCTFKQILSFWR